MTRWYWSIKPTYPRMDNQRRWKTIEEGYLCIWTSHETPYIGRSGGLVFWGFIA